MSDQPTDVIIPFVLDRSGSMGNYIGATIQGFNDLLKEQQEQDGRAWLSLTLFDNQFDIRYVAWDVKDIPKMGKSGPNTYDVRGSTALYDAVGLTIDGTEKWLANNSDWFDGKVLFVMLTDGHENASTRWTIEALNAKISEKRAEGWEFVFLGAGGAAWTEGNKFTSIPQEQRFTRAATNEGFGQTYAGVSASVSSLRSAGVADYSSLTSTNVENAEESADAAVNSLAGLNTDGSVRLNKGMTSRK